jgi:hypothetical protein
MPSEKPLSQKALVSKSPWIRAQIDRTLVRFYGCIKNKLVLDSMTDSLLARTKKEGANSSFVHFAQVSNLLGSEG